MTNLIDKIDGTRERWVEELKDCRESLLNHHPVHVPNPLDRLVVELDYLLVEAKLRLRAVLKAFDYACEDSLESVLEEMREQAKLKTQNVSPLETLEKLGRLAANAGKAPSHEKALNILLDISNLALEVVRKAKEKR